MWAQGNPFALPVHGEPQCTLHFDPKSQVLRLQSPFSPPQPDLARLRNINFTQHTSGKLTTGSLSVAVDANLHGVYSLMATIVDQLQMAGETFAVAVEVALDKHRNVILNRAGMSTEKEIGLLGELLVLEKLVDICGTRSAIESWKGPQAGEHDFVFDDIHFEVKTTASEQRRHMMHGFTQLVPNGSTPLTLLSLQLTRSTPDAGRSLTSVVDDVRSAVSGYRVRLDQALTASGWSDADSDLYNSYWDLRSPVAAYSVDESFPAVTIARLKSSVPSWQTISDLSYRVDVTSLNTQALPMRYAAIVEPRKAV